MRRREPLSKQTMRHIQNLLSKVLEQAVKDGLMEQNPAQGICFSDNKQVQATILADDEMYAYLKAAEELGYQTIFLPAFKYGLRQRELIALMWSDIDTKYRTLTVHEGERSLT